MSTRFCLCACALIALPAIGRAQNAPAGNAFNPALSFILDGKYAHYSIDPDTYRLPGFLLGDEAGLAPRGFSIGESELAASANVDDKFFGQVTVALDASGDHTDVNVEEAFIQTTALPAGVGLKFGRFFSDIGYLNSKHAHAWDFVDQPLAYKAMLGMQYGDDGVQLRYVVPANLLIEIGGEVFRGAQFPAGGAARGGLGAWTAFAHVGGDIGSSLSWRGGVSYLNADSNHRESTEPNGDVFTFGGESRLWIADFVLKWADHGNPKTRNFVVQGEYLRRQERGAVIVDPSLYAAVTLPATLIPNGNYGGTQRGWYLQGVYQFRPRWRAGLRYDSLDASNRGPNLGVRTPLDDSHSPRRLTAMVDFANSEFSRLRLQAARDESRPERDTQLTVQYVMSIGAHGAHQF